MKIQEKNSVCPNTSMGGGCEPNVAQPTGNRIRVHTAIKRKTVFRMADIAFLGGRSCYSYGTARCSAAMLVTPLPRYTPDPLLFKKFVFD